MGYFRGEKRASPAYRLRQGNEGREAGYPIRGDWRIWRIWRIYGGVYEADSVSARPWVKECRGSTGVRDMKIKAAAQTCPSNIVTNNHL